MADDFKTPPRPAAPKPKVGEPYRAPRASEAVYTPTNKDAATVRDLMERTTGPIGSPKTVRRQIDREEDRRDRKIARGASVRRTQAPPYKLSRGR